jgi:hypothetical protein
MNTAVPRWHILPLRRFIRENKIMKKHLSYIFSVATLTGLVAFGGMTVPATASTEAARDDSAYIQNLIDSAVADSDGMKTVTVPAVNPNDPNGGSTYLLSNFRALKKQYYQHWK